MNYVANEADADKIRRAVREVLANEFAPRLRRRGNTPDTNVRWLGKTVSAIDVDTSGDVRVYFRPADGAKGSEVASDPALTISCYNRFSDILGDKWVFIEFIDGGWEVYQARC